MDKPIKVIIADDHKLFTEGLRSLLESTDDICVVDVAADGQELMELLQPGIDLIVLLDINMPKLNGLEAALKISQQYEQIKMIILSTYSEGHLVQKAKQYGCKGYVVKTADTDELMDGIRRVHQGQEYFLKPVSTESSLTEDEAIVKKYKLTRRELEILELLRKEMTNKEISETLFLSVYTIETHRKNIMQKLGLKTPAALIRFFMSNDGG